MLQIQPFRFVNPAGSPVLYGLDQVTPVQKHGRSAGRLKPATPPVPDRTGPTDRSIFIYIYLIVAWSSRYRLLHTQLY